MTANWRRHGPAGNIPLTPESQSLSEVALQGPLEISHSYCIPISTAVWIFDAAFLAQFSSNWKLDVKTLLALQLKNGVELMQHISKACEDAMNTEHIDFIIFRVVQLGVASFAHGLIILPF